MAAMVIVSTMIGIVVSWRVPGLETNARDWLMRQRGNLPPAQRSESELVIVAIDEAGLATFGKPFTQQREIRNRLRPVSDRPFGGSKKFIYLMAHTPSLPRLAANCKRAISQLDRT